MSFTGLFYSPKLGGGSGNGTLQGRIFAVTAVLQRKGCFAWGLTGSLGTTRRVRFAVCFRRAFDGRLDIAVTGLSGIPQDENSEFTQLP